MRLFRCISKCKKIRCIMVSVTTCLVFPSPVPLREETALLRVQLCRQRDMIEFTVTFFVNFWHSAPETLRFLSSVGYNFWFSAEHASNKNCFR